MNALIESKRSEIEELCRRYHVRQLWIFGSAAREDFDPGRSDVDFLVEFQDIKRHGFNDVYWLLMEALEDLLGRHVDLIEPAAIRNDIFRREVDRTRVPLYAA